MRIGIAKVVVLAVVSVLITTMCLFSGCGLRVRQVSSESGTGTLQIYLTDAPFNADEIKITISKVEVHGVEGGWVTVANFEPPKEFNLIELPTVGMLLGETTLPTGHYTQIRLIMTKAEIIVNGTSYDLYCPSGTVMGFGNARVQVEAQVGKTGIKLIHQFTINANELTELLLDFNAEKSIVKTGNNQYLLKPVIPVVAKVISGTVSGKIVDANTGNPISGALVTAYLAGTTTAVNSGSSDAEGNFVVNTLPAGTYDIEVTATGYQATKTLNVAVVAQQNTDIGTIQLTSTP